MPAVPSDDPPCPDPGPDALSALVEQRDRLVAAIVARTGLDASRAEDALHSVVERVLRKGLAPRDDESWFVYLRQAALNQAVNDTRHRARAQARELDYLLTGRDAAANAVAVRMLMLDALADLDTLPEQQRQVFWLRHYEGMRAADIAAVTGLSPRGVESALRRARERLRALHADRETTPGYLLLAVLATGRRTGTAGAPVITIAAMTALSVLAVVAVPAPRATLVDALRPGRDVVRGDRQRIAPGAGTAAAAASDADRGRLDAPPRVVTTVHTSRPGALPRLPHLLPDHPEACAGPVCVGGRRPGDRISVNRVPGQSLAQAVTPVCWMVPDNPELTCESGDRGDYTAPRPSGQDSPTEGVKSSPSAPETREPSKGTSR